jgi:hypothetical protein
MRHLQRVVTRFDLAWTGNEHEGSVVTDFDIANPDESCCFRMHRQ